MHQTILGTLFMGGNNNWLKFNNFIIQKIKKIKICNLLKINLV